MLKIAIYIGEIFSIRYIKQNYAKIWHYKSKKMNSNFLIPNYKRRKSHAVPYI